MNLLNRNNVPNNFSIFDSDPVYNQSNANEFSKSTGVNFDNDYTEDSGLSDAEAQGISAGVGAVSKIVSTGIQVGAQSKQLNAARDEARRLAAQEREDLIKQANIDDTFKRRGIQQQEQQMKINQAQYATQNRFDNYMYHFEQNLKKFSKIKKAANNVVNFLNKNPQASDSIQKHWGVI